MLVSLTLLYLFLILSIGLHDSVCQNCWNTYVLSFHVLSLLPGLGRTLVIFLCHAQLAESGVNHGNWLTFL
jgi:hypothetical protein